MFFKSRSATSVHVPGHSGKMFKFTLKELTVVEDPRDVAKFRNSVLLIETDKLGNEVIVKRRVPFKEQEKQLPISYSRLGKETARMRSEEHVDGSRLEKVERSESSEVQGIHEDFDSEKRGTPEGFKCMECGLVLASEKGYTIHLKRVHNKEV